MGDRGSCDIGPGDSEEDWKDSAGGCGGCFARDEECHVGFRIRSMGCGVIDV